jgi:hypothetical protein
VEEGSDKDRGANCDVIGQGELWPLFPHNTGDSQNQSHNQFTTDGQSISPSYGRALAGVLTRFRFYVAQQ